MFFYSLSIFFLQKNMPRRKTGEEFNFTYVECLLYTFHHLAHKVLYCQSTSFVNTYEPINIMLFLLEFFVVQVPNATNSLCGYKIVTGQPSDRLGEDFTEQYKEFTERYLYPAIFPCICILLLILVYTILFVWKCPIQYAWGNGLAFNFHAIEFRGKSSRQREGWLLSSHSSWYLFIVAPLQLELLG